MMEPSRVLTGRVKIFTCIMMKGCECVSGRASTLGSQTLLPGNRNIMGRMEEENQMIWSWIDFLF